MAIACASGDIELTVLAKRQVGTLWDDVEGKFYPRLFNNGLDGTYLWRTVQIWRAIDTTLRAIGKAEGRPGLIAVHGSTIIALKVFQDPSMAGFRDYKNDISTLIGQATALAVSVHTCLCEVIAKNYPDAYPQSLFKNTEKCRLIIDDLDLSPNMIEAVSVQSRQMIPRDVNGQTRMF